MNRINVCLDLTGFMVWGPARAAGAKSEGQGRFFYWSHVIKDNIFQGLAPE